MKTTIKNKRPRILWANRYCLLDTSSGASISARQILLQLKRRGWDVRILGCTTFDSERGMGTYKKYCKSNPGKPFVKIKDKDGLEHLLVVTSDSSQANATNSELNRLYQIYLSTLSEFQPDFVFFYGGMALDLLIADEARSRNITTLAYLVNANYLNGTRWCRDVDMILTDSKATANLYKEKLNLNVTPIGKFIEPKDVLADKHERKHIVFINPSVEKGGYLVAQLAFLLSKQRPDITFEVVESRGLWHPVLNATLKAMGEKTEPLPNVIVTPNQEHMKDVFARARLLIAPSLWWESGARVLAEAMLNGLPAIVTAHGGSPEMIEDGGITFKIASRFHEAPYTRIPKSDVFNPLIERIISLFDDDVLYRELSKNAFRVGQNLHNIEVNTDRFIREIENLKDSKSLKISSDEGTHIYSSKYPK